MLSDARLCQLCADAYKDNGPDGWILDAATPAHHAGPRAFVLAAPDGSRTVVFRGTTDAEGWVTDLDAERAPCGFGDGIAVHEGFVAHWQFLRERIAPAVKGAQVLGRPVTLAGHSLGGAMATLAAIELARTGYRVERVVTFGSPRVGNAAFAGAYELAGLVEKTTRYVHSFDPVPWLPTCLFGFRHVCPATWYDGAIWRPWSWLAYGLLAGADLAIGWPPSLASLRRAPAMAAGCHLMDSYTSALPPEG